MKFKRIIVFLFLTLLFFSCGKKGGKGEGGSSSLEGSSSVQDYSLWGSLVQNVDQLSDDGYNPGDDTQGVDPITPVGGGGGTAGGGGSTGGNGGTSGGGGGCPQDLTKCPPFQLNICNLIFDMKTTFINTNGVYYTSGNGVILFNNYVNLKFNDLPVHWYGHWHQLGWLPDGDGAVIIPIILGAKVRYRKDFDSNIIVKSLSGDDFYKGQVVSGEPTGTNHYITAFRKNGEYFANNLLEAQGLAMQVPGNNTPSLKLAQSGAWSGGILQQLFSSVSVKQRWDQGDMKGIITSAGPDPELVELTIQIPIFQDPATQAFQFAEVNILAPNGEFAPIHRILSDESGNVLAPSSEDGCYQDIPKTRLLETNFNPHLNSWWSRDFWVYPTR